MFNRRTRFMLTTRYRNKKTPTSLILVCFFMFFQINAFAASISDFTRGMLHVDGYYEFYYDKDSGKLFLAVDKEKKPFLFQSSLPQGLGSNDIGLDRGQLGDTRIVQFERHGNKLMLVQLNTQYRASSKNKAEQKSVEEAFAKSIIHGFDIQAQTRGTLLVDYTEFLLTDIHDVADTLKATEQGSYRLDTSRSAVHFAQSKSFPKNTELEAILTFTGSKPGQYVKQIAPDPSALTVTSRHSLIKLPDDKYQPRVFHPYSGFWSVEHQDYSAAIDDTMAVKVIPRHRLKKRYPNKALSKPVEPIIYYLDPGTPEPVRTALLDGAKWWAEAFEEAGFTDAFQVKMLPPHADPMDVRYNTIQWVHRATRGWSYGASVIDPRTGEIIKGHVTLGSLRVRQDYLLAQGLTAPFTSDTPDTRAIKNMALDRIRQLSAHEIGHTLGIAHNFSASVDQRASVMDYPHPLVKIKDGKIDLSQAYAKGIGVWDKHVIKYGYAEFSVDKNEKDELAAIINQAQQLGLKYMSDPDARPSGGANADGHLWDNGTDPAAELKRVMAVRKLALANFGLNNLAANRPLSDLQEILVPIYLFHRYQVTAAGKLIAGVDYHYGIKNDGLPSPQAVSKARQTNALEQLLATLQLANISLPKPIIDLIPPKAYGSARTRESAPTQIDLVFDPTTLASANIQHTLDIILNKQRLNRIALQWSLDQAPWSLPQYLKAIVEQTVKQTPNSPQQQLLYQRLAAATIEQLMALLTDKKSSIEIKSAVLVAINDIGNWLSVTMLQKHDFPEAALALFKHHLDWYLEHRKWLPMVEKVKMPPGSPI